MQYNYKPYTCQQNGTMTFIDDKTSKKLYINSCFTNVEVKQRRGKTEDAGLNLPPASFRYLSSDLLKIYGKNQLFFGSQLL